MAKRSAQETAAAKAKKQKKILIVGAVLLLAVAAFQVPKMMKGGGSAAAPASTTAPVAGAPVAGAVTGTPVPVAVTAVPTKGSAVIAGVALPKGAVVKAETSQLASFTLFEVKDPFVPQVGDEEVAAADPSSSQNGAAPPADTGAGTTGTDTSAGSTGGSPPAGPPPATPPAPVVYATIDFNTKPQQLQVKGTFPTPEPLFVLRSLTKKQAKINVAGGSFDGGKPVTLKLGKKVTLVNTATGVRYVLKLTYTGAQPEVIQGFTKTTTAPDGAATTPTP
jgi:hypothetical protein